MRAFRFWIAIATFSIAFFAFLSGLILEYRQSRQTGPIAIIPTLPYAVASGILVLLGLLNLPYQVSWWIFPLAFVSTVGIAGFMIRCASKNKG